MAQELLDAASGEKTLKSEKAFRFGAWLKLSSATEEGAAGVLRFVICGTAARQRHPTGRIRNNPATLHSTPHEDFNSSRNTSGPFTHPYTLDSIRKDCSHVVDR